MIDEKVEMLLWAFLWRSKQSFNISRVHWVNMKAFKILFTINPTSTDSQFKASANQCLVLHQVTMGYKQPQLLIYNFVLYLVFNKVKRRLMQWILSDGNRPLSCKWGPVNTKTQSDNKSKAGVWRITSETIYLMHFWGKTTRSKNNSDSDMVWHHFQQIQAEGFSHVER